MGIAASEAFPQFLMLKSPSVPSCGKVSRSIACGECRLLRTAASTPPARSALVCEVRSSYGLSASLALQHYIRQGPLSTDKLSVVMSLANRQRCYVLVEVHIRFPSTANPRRRWEECGTPSIARSRKRNF